MTTTAGLALPFHGPRDTARITRDRIEILSQEVGSGRSSDSGRALSSDFSGLSQVSHQLHTLQSVRESLGRAEAWGAALQGALSQIAEAGVRVSSALPASLAAAEDGFVQAAATGRGAAEDIGAALQRSVAGRALFANGAEAGPLASIQTILDDASALAVGASDFEGYVQDIDAYFAAGGSYETDGLTGFQAAPIRFPAGGGAEISFSVDATSDQVRDALKQAVLVAGLADAGFDTRNGAGTSIAIELQRRSAQVGADLPQLQGQIGVQEERAAGQAQAAEVAMQDAERAVSDALGVDPFEAATRLQNELSRLESLYAITARRSQLRLTDYL